MREPLIPDPDETQLVIESAKGRYDRAIVTLIIVVALFEMINGVLNISLLVAQGNEQNKRSQVTRDVVITAASCIIDLSKENRESPTEKAIRKCVAERRSR